MNSFEKKIICAVLTLSSSTTLAHNPDPIEGQEKCYGIVKAEQNDCGNSYHGFVAS